MCVGFFSWEKKNDKMFPEARFSKRIFGHSTESTELDRPLANSSEESLRSEKNSLNIEFLGGIFLGHPGPRRRDIPDKNFMQVAFFCCFRQEVARMSRDLGQDVPDLEKLYARKLRADFSYPKVKKWSIRNDFRAGTNHRNGKCGKLLFEGHEVL